MTQILDIHPHIISEDTVRYPLAPLGGKRSDWSSEAHVEVEQLIAAMDAAGVAKAAVVQSATTYGSDNSYVADSVARFPDRLTGVFTVDILADDAAERIAYWNDRGLTGLRIFSKGSTIAKQWLSLDDDRLAPAIEKTIELGLSLCINVHANEEELLQVHALLKRYPSLPVILDHLGRVKVSDGAPYGKAKPLFDLAQYPNMFLKISPRLLQDLGADGSVGTPETFIPTLVKAFGANRIAFGSNYPASKGSLSEIVNAMKLALQVLSADEQQQILSGTAARLYPALA